MMTGNDLAVLLNPFVIIGALVIVAAILGGPWLRDRYIFRELNRDTGVTRQQPTALFTPGRAGNPPLVYFLELHYAERLDTVLMLHRVGAIASLQDGSMTMHDRAGRLLTHLSALDVAYYRRLDDTAPQPPNPE